MYCVLIVRSEQSGGVRSKVTCMHRQGPVHLLLQNCTLYGQLTSAGQHVTRKYIVNARSDSINSLAMCCTVPSTFTPRHASDFSRTLLFRPPMRAGARLRALTLINSSSRALKIQQMIFYRNVPYSVVCEHRLSSKGPAR
jgi:hypothetical protein